MTITLDRTIPGIHPRAIGVVRGTMRISQFSRDVALNTTDGFVLRGKISTATQNKILRNLEVLTVVADWQCWIRTVSRDISLIPLKFEITDTPSPDVDRFIICGVNLGTRKPGVVCLGINSPNEAVKRFWVKSHGTVQDNIIGGIYETECVRKNTRLYIVRSKLVGMTKTKSSNKTPIKRTEKLTLARV